MRIPSTGLLINNGICHVIINCVRPELKSARLIADCMAAEAEADISPHLLPAGLLIQVVARSRPTCHVHVITR